MAIVNVRRLLEVSGAGTKTRRLMAVNAGIFTIAALSHYILVGFANQAAGSPELHAVLIGAVIATPIVMLVCMAAQVVLILGLAIATLIRVARSPK